MTLALRNSMKNHKRNKLLGENHQNTATLLFTRSRSCRKNDNGYAEQKNNASTRVFTRNYAAAQRVPPPCRHAGCRAALNRVYEFLMSPWATLI
jgi:hypothetical protein